VESSSLSHEADEHAFTCPPHLKRVRIDPTGKKATPRDHHFGDLYPILSVDENGDENGGRSEPIFAIPGQSHLPEELTNPMQIRPQPP
jgi:hypothetical protein